MAIRKPEVSTVSACTHWPPEGWWAVALNTLLRWTMPFSLGFFKTAQMLFSGICLFEKLFFVLSHMRWTELPGFTLLVLHEYSPLRSENFPMEILKCRTYFIPSSPPLLQFFYAQAKERDRERINMLTYCLRRILCTLISTTEDNWYGKYEYSILIKEKRLITRLHSDNSFEMWVGWCLSHVLLIGRCHKTSKIRYVVLFLCLCYWTVFSKIFSVAAAAFDPNTAMSDTGLFLEWRPYSRRLKGHFSTSSAVVFDFVELEVCRIQELSNKLGSNIQIL